MKSNFKEWISKAENDLKTALILLNTEEPLPDIICFHCQQCAEKYLKAYLAYKNIFFPKTHILGNLLRLCTTVNVQFDTIETFLRILDDYSVAPRYPDEWNELTTEDAQTAYQAALDVKNFIESNFLR